MTTTSYINYWSMRTELDSFGRVSGLQPPDHSRCTEAFKGEGDDSEADIWRATNWHLNVT